MFNSRLIRQEKSALMFINDEKEKILKNKIELKRRRVNWISETKPKLIDISNKFLRTIQDQGFPFSMWSFDSHDESNLETYQISFSSNDLDVVFNDKTHNKNTVKEEGCSLVFSQGPTGLIMVILTPYSSSVHHREEENIYLKRGLLPEDISEEIILEMIKISMKYARMSSLLGSSSGYSISDQIFLLKLRFLDIRSQNKRKKDLLSLESNWWKLIITSGLTLAVTLIAQNYSP